VICQTTIGGQGESPDVERRQRESQMRCERERDDHEQREEERRDLGDRADDDRDREI
jgi:hypothetical protein